MAARTVDIRWAPCGDHRIRCFLAMGSFTALAAYVSDLKKIGDPRDWQKTADYILDAKGGGERVEAIRVTNCANEEPGLALVEIAAVQERNTKSQTDKTYHLIVSFPPGEKPTPGTLHDIEDNLCAAIGLADHQRISAVHNDKDHFTSTPEQADSQISAFVDRRNATRERVPEILPHRP